MDQCEELGLCLAPGRRIPSKPEPPVLVTVVLNQTASRLRYGLLRALTCVPIDALWTAFLGARCTILMFHRFDGSGDHHSAASFRQMLRYLRNRRYVLVDLEVVIRAILDGVPLPRRAVAITCDDGYEEHFEVALPILAEFDVPATFFLTTGFTDGKLWLWWDQLEYLLIHSRRPGIDLTVNGARFHYDLSNGPARAWAAQDLTERCKAVSNGLLIRTIQAASRAVECDLPTAPPPEYRPLTWDQARIAERFGVRFGPATVSHPVLSRLDAAAAAYEIEYSWQRICAELTRPTPIFCYPNGKNADFGPREIQLCAAAGLLGAVTAEPGYVAPGAQTKSPHAPYLVPRFSGPENLPQLVRLTSGLQVLLAALPR